MGLANASERTRTRTEAPKAVSELRKTTFSAVSSLSAIGIANSSFIVASTEIIPSTDEYTDQSPISSGEYSLETIGEEAAIIT